MTQADKSHFERAEPLTVSPVELTILMPCLNEALTVATCIASAQSYLRLRGISGEILVADNGSTDGSQEIASLAGARVINVAQKGYGAALISGINAAAGRYIIMADADDSYDLADLDGFVEQLRRGIQLVVGNRFAGGIRPGAMPTLNRYLGNPVLTFIGRRLFSSPVRDFHCGIRGFDREAISELELKCAGMEFASEMVVKASLSKLSIAEVPTTLRPDGRGRPPHLKPWRDGWRHLRFMLLSSPQMLFLWPGVIIFTLSLLGAVALTIKPWTIARVLTLDIDALLYFAIAAIVGAQITFFGLFAMAIARKLQINVAQGLPARFLKPASLEASLAFGAFLITCGIGGACYSVFHWGHTSFGPLVPSEIMRITIPSVTVLAIGTQIVFGSFLLGFIEME
jgi:glycosyltransferase involved in cell wall biosynthesis